MSSTRGWRNNNPGNIKYNAAVKWQGLDTPPNDGVFNRFESLAWGIRACIKLASTYKRKYGVQTLGEYMGRYAPVGPENPANYHTWVSVKTGIGLEEEIDLEDRDTLQKILRAQFAFENGATLDEVDQRIPIEVWNTAFSLANPLRKSTILRAAAGTAGSIAAGVVEVATNHADTLTSAGAAASALWPRAAPWVMGGVALAFLAVIVVDRLRMRAEGVK